MNNNHLTTIPEGVFEKMTYLKNVRLDVNPLHCDCSLKWLYTFTKSKRVPVLISAACQTPTQFYGKAFKALKATDFKCSKYNPALLSLDRRNSPLSPLLLPRGWVGSCSNPI